MTLLVSAYILTIGGTFSGVVNFTLARLSLTLVTGGVVIWASVALFFAPQNHGQWSRLGPALALWLLAYGASTLNSPTSRALMGVWYAGFYAGCWLILTDLRSRGLPARWIADSLLFASVPLMLVALVQVREWFPAWWALRDLPVAFVPPRPSATLGNANALGTFLAAVIPIALVRVRNGTRLLHRMVWSVWSAVAFVTLYLTTSRGAWLATLAGIALVVVLWQYREHTEGHPQPGRVRKHSHIRVLVIASAVAVVAIIVLTFTVQTFDTPRRDLSPRLGFYRTALETWRDYPLTGSGPFTFGLRLQEQVSVPPIQPHSHAHNLALNVIAELGLLGLVALVITLGLVLYYAWHKLHEQHAAAGFGEQAGYCAAVVAISVHSMVDMTLMMPAIMLLALAALNLCIQPDEPTQPEKTARRYGLRQLVWGGTLIALWSGLLIGGWRFLEGYETYIQGELTLLDGDFAAGAELLADVTQEQPDVALYWAEYGFAAGLAASAGDEKWLAPGIQAYEQALKLEPSHAAWWANQAALLWQSDAQAQAIEAMRQATEIAPEFPDFWLNLGMYYESAEMSADARAAYMQVLKLRQDWGFTEFWHVTDLRRATIADYPLTPTPYIRAQALAAEGEWDQAVEVLKATIERDPAQPNPYSQIARLYAEGGSPEQAVRYLDAARLLVHADPDAAWIAYVDALLAQAAGDEVEAQELLTQARDLLGPADTGYSLLYGLEVAYFQFLRAKIPALFLPQLMIVGPYPDLRDLLWTAS